MPCVTENEVVAAHSNRNSVSSRPKRLGRYNDQAVAKHMATFGGVKRRLTENIIGDQVIIDDFAHHPTEIEATVDAARQKYPNKEIVAVFQPHTFTRTIALIDDFATSLNQADAVYLAQIDRKSVV